MPKKYKADKRGKYAEHDQQKMKDAVAAVNGGMSVRKAAALYKIPKSTINDRVKGRVEMDSSKGRKPFLSQEVEKEIVEKITDSAAKGFGISKRQLLTKVGILCKKTSVATFKNGVPSKDWYYSFKKRNPEISLRKPEKMETNRARMLNTVVLNNYFDELTEVMNRLGLADKPQYIWNADETGKQLGHTPGKVLGTKGARSIVSRTSNDRSNITIMASVNAAGRHMPPMMIVKGKTTKCLYGYNTAAAPTGTKWTYQQKAWMNDEIGHQWFEEVFLRHCRPERPQLLIMDGHGSHETFWNAQNRKILHYSHFLLTPHTSYNL